MPTDQSTQHDQGVMESRLAALASIFSRTGRAESLIASPTPFRHGGDPCIARFEGLVKAGSVYCTCEMTGGQGSGQWPGPKGETEFVIVVRHNSLLGPVPADPFPGTLNGRTPTGGVWKGWTGIILGAVARLSCQGALSSGDTIGPLEVPALMPMEHLLLTELTTARFPFQYLGNSYGLLLCTLITQAEYEFKLRFGTKELVRRLRAAGIYPCSEVSRPPVTSRQATGAIAASGAAGGTRAPGQTNMFDTSGGTAAGNSAAGTKAGTRVPIGAPSATQRR